MSKRKRAATSISLITALTLFPFYSIPATLTNSTFLSMSSFCFSFGRHSNISLYPIFHIGTSLEYERIFKRIILELQRCQDDYEEMLTLLLRHLLIIFHRELTRKHVLKNEYLDHEMDTAASYFDENYNRDINIEEYAISRGMSVSWFIRNFKKFTGTTPMQFITSIRITNSQMLLETTNYAVNEIARIVGYDNPLYFSRLFHKQKGCSPSEYRKLLK